MKTSLNNVDEIYINGRFLTRRLTGVDRFALETLYALDELVFNKPVKVTLLLPRKWGGIVPKFKSINVSRFGLFGGVLWEQIDLPVRALNGLLINLCNAAPVFKINQIVVVHDAAPVAMPGTYGKMFSTWYRFMVPMLGILSKKICTVSQFSKMEIARHYGINLGKIFTVSESGEHILSVCGDPEILKKFELENNKYFLCVGSLSPHKNFDTVIRAVELIGKRLGSDVVIAGSVNPSVFASVEIPSCVKYVGYVTDGELKSLYENARCFIFPSLYEGFGLPPLEAMSLGCPVIASNAASIPEVCGDVVEYFDPRSSKELADIMQKVDADKDGRALLEDGLKKYASSFSWRNTASQILKICGVML